MQEPIEHTTDGRHHTHDLKRLPRPIISHQMASEETATASTQTKMGHSQNADKTGNQISRRKKCAVCSGGDPHQVNS